MNPERILSIVVPVFNRAWCLPRCLASSRAFLRAAGGGEIVIVDDGSTDNSVQIARDFARKSEGECYSVTVVEQPRNGGVSAAKNAGARVASGEWLVFLDSDDELLAEASRAMLESLRTHAASPLHFFRCIGEDGARIGTAPPQAAFRDLRSMLLAGTGGECLPVVNRAAFLRFPYDDDLRGFEGIAYLRIVRHVAHAVIHPVTARRYYTSHDGRLSTAASMRRRASTLARGYWRVVSEHGRRLGVRGLAFALVRAAYHGARGLLAS